MLSIRVIPVLLWSDGGLVKSRRFSEDRYIGDPINAIRIFNEKGADELVLLDITATKRNAGPNYELVETCASECFMPMAYGGGISQVEHMAKLFSLGVEKILVNTAAYGDLGWIREAVQQFGSQSVACSIDVKKGMLGGYSAVIDRGSRKAPRGLIEQIEACQNAGVGEILLTAVHADGLMQGYDETLIRQVAPSIRVPLIACGGAGSLQHLRGAVMAGADAVAAGSFFVFHGKHRAVLITYPDYQALTETFVGTSKLTEMSNPSK